MDPFTVLGLTRRSTEKQVKAAYRRLALRWHPDKAGAGATAKFQQIGNAYEKIMSQKLYWQGEPMEDSFQTPASHSRPQTPEPHSHCHSRFWANCPDCDQSASPEQPSAPPEPEQPPAFLSHAHRFWSIAQDLHDILAGEQRRRRNTTRITTWVEMETEISKKISEVESHSGTKLPNEKAREVGKILYAVKRLSEAYSFGWAKEVWARATFTELAARASIERTLSPLLMREVEKGFDIARLQHQEKVEKEAAARAESSGTRPDDTSETQQQPPAEPEAEKPEPKDTRSQFEELSLSD